MENYFVYQHVTPDGMYYFGVTKNIKKRFFPSKYETTTLLPYIEKYGWNNIKHIVLFRNETYESSRFIEDFLISTAMLDGVCINKQRSGFVSMDNNYVKERNRKYKKQYIDEHLEEIKEKKKKYYKENKEKIKEYYKQYQEEHKEELKEYKKQYYQRKRQENQNNVN